MLKLNSANKSYGILGHKSKRIKKRKRRQQQLN